MANQITRDIYVLRKSIIEPIHYVRLTNAVDIVFNMRDYEIPSGAVAAVYAQKPDGTAVYSNATISENTVTVEMTTQMVAVLGVGHLQVRIQSGSNSADVLCSFVVPLIVEPNYTEGDFPPSQNENGFFGDVEEHLQQVESDMTTMKEEWTEFQSDITQQVQEIQEEQTTQGNEITDLQKKVAKLDEEKSPALVLDASGSWVAVEDSGDSAANGLTIHGKSTQVVTTGAQLIDFSKASFNNCLLENANTGTLKSNITDFYYGSIGITYLNEYLLSKRGETITFSAIDGIPEKMMSIIIFGTRANGTTYQEKNGTLGKNLVSLTVAQDFETITGVSLGFNRSSSAFTDTNTLVTGVMLNTGNTAIPFEPYTGGAPSPSPDYPQEITSVGDSGSVEVVSTGANLYAGGDIQGITGRLQGKISVPCPGEPLIIKAVLVPVSGVSKVYVGISYYDSENNMLGNNGANADIGTQNTDFVFHAKGTNANDGANVDMTDVKKINFTFTLASPEDGEFDIREVMVCTDRDESEAMFSGYQSSTATFSTPNGLPGIPVDSSGNYTDADGQQWICDEIDTKAGVYRQRVAKKTVSIDRINLEFEDRGILAGVDDHINSPVTSNAICDRSIYAKSETSGTFYINKNANAVFLFEGVYSEQSLEEVKELFDGATVLYAIDPVETPLSDAELIEAGNLRTFATTTNVTTEDPVDPEITLEYAADLKTYIDKKLAEISAATLENATNASQ